MIPKNGLSRSSKSSKGEMNEDLWDSFQDSLYRAVARDPLERSQNRTTQESTHGQKIKFHDEKEIKVHLLIRKKKVENGKASPFTYCGEVSYVSWENEKPITVKWKLSEPVPERWLGEFTLA